MSERDEGWRDDPDMKIFTVCYRTNGNEFYLGFGAPTEAEALAMAAPFCPKGEGYTYSVIDSRDGRTEP